RAPRHQGAADDFAGTPLYLAPEVFEGHARTKATDIYSLGVLLYHLVTGSYPVEGRARAEVERGWLNSSVRRITIVACTLGVVLTMGAAYWVAGRMPRRAGGDAS